MLRLDQTYRRPLRAVVVSVLEHFLKIRDTAATLRRRTGQGPPFLRRWRDDVDWPSHWLSGVPYLADPEPEIDGFMGWGFCDAIDNGTGITKPIVSLPQRLALSVTGRASGGQLDTDTVQRLLAAMLQSDPEDAGVSSAEYKLYAPLWV